MYKHFKVNRMMSTAGRVVRELFDLFILEPQLLPKELFDQTTGPETFETARVVCDYIAAMTDTFAISEHKKLYQPAGYF
jgi:dGTPase